MIKMRIEIPVDNDTYIKFLNLSDEDREEIRDMVKKEISRRSK